MSSLLNDFYHAWWDWVEAGAPEENEYGFYSRYSLCSSLVEYSKAENWTTSELREARLEMKNQFNYHDLDLLVPFNVNVNDYDAEKDKTKNNLRTSFVWMNMVPKNKA